MRRTGSPEAAPDPLTDLELAAVLQVAPEPWKPVLALMALTGLRWGDRPAGHSWTPGAAERRSATRRDREPGGEGLVLGTYRDLWAAEVTRRNPALRFLMPKQKLELAARDAESLAVANGDEVTVSVNGQGVDATVAIRERMREGAAFLIEGTDLGNGNLLTNGAPPRIRVVKR